MDHHPVTVLILCEALQIEFKDAVPDIFIVFRMKNNVIRSIRLIQIFQKECCQ